MKHSFFTYFIKLLIIFFAYLLTGYYGLKFNAVNEFATLVWIPSGIALASLLLFGFRLWPAITFGAFFVNFFTGAPVLVAIGIAIGNTLEPVVGAYLLRKVLKFQNSLNQVNDVVSLALVAAPVCTIISATVGVSSLVLGGVIQATAFYPTWIAWWIGDLISVILITPFLLTWVKDKPYIFERSRFVEFLMLVFSIGFVGSMLFLEIPKIISKDTVVLYIIYPLLIWAGLRFSQALSVTATLFLSALAIWGTAQGMGPFIQNSLSASLLNLQSFMGVTIVTSLVFAAVVAERREFEERKDEFIAMAAHELKTPMTILKLFTQSLLQNAKKEKDRQFVVKLTKMDFQLVKLTKLVDELLDISKIYLGKLEINKELFLIRPLIEEVVGEINLQTKTKDHKIYIEGFVKKQVFADRDRIRQVLINLITNGVKYSPPKSKIIISLRENKRLVIVNVKDHGFGISTKEAVKIFDRFYQSRTLKGKTYPGLGLGLYICSQIIKNHQGKLWVKSIEDKGSMFSFSLPAK